jgi:hypothetical protein
LLSLDHAQRSELETLLRLEINAQEKDRIVFLLSGGRGPRVVGGTPSSDLLALFSTVGHLAVLDAPGGRGASFAANQNQGAWAESLLRAYTGSYRFVNFGLSTPVAPTAPEYEAVRRQHRYILLHEGKRPDLLLVPESTLTANSSILTWERRVLTASDRSFLTANALAGVEIKSSRYDWGQRQRYRSAPGNTANPVSIPLKDEEIPDLTRWQAENRIPIMIIQTFVDTMHGCSFDQFKDEINNGRARRNTEPKTTKATYYLPLPDATRKIADILLASGQSAFAVAAKGEVANPRAWPQASLANVNLTRIVSRAAELKAQYASHLVGGSLATAAPETRR